MLSFLNDYSEGGHPRVMEDLMRTNQESTVGYGFDRYCKEARSLIARKIKQEGAETWFLAGGTLTNLTVIAHALKPHQAVITACTGHINVHETGAIEATGHKVLGLPSENGKLTSKMIEDCLAYHEDFFFVEPKMVYISNTTEVGTIYSKKELMDLKACCEKNNLYLFMDGARLAYALGAEENDITWEDLGRYTDVLFIGGTKCGAMFGEAVTIIHEDLKKDFKYSIKQRGGLFAKGRLIGVQFISLLQENLYEEIGKRANEAARILRDGLKELGFISPYDSPSNQQFVLMTEEEFQKISSVVLCGVEGKWKDGRCRVRFVTGWKNTEEEAKEAIEKIQEILS
ncbi:amino acid lyase [Fusobacterium necrophorum BFTR-1]|uniref:threonine aldolase family protein n=1 Tax=Fusobacterium necrophorum TaxID=859 RepID=UPI0004612BA0|nr:aminotransferase class I/II-fold pyridoxal phosphate-dependent enzyme [Fusobacterium necrophorum]KDE62440.1 amino acid lyase [Fusobacterium necrophorum BFTR-1]